MTALHHFLVLPFSLTRTICERACPSPIPRKISCSLSSTELPLIWLILQALDKLEWIPVGCCNAGALQRWLSLAPFNLSRRRRRRMRIMFLCKKSPTPYASDVCNVDRGSHQGAGKRKWHHNLARASVPSASREAVVSGRVRGGRGIHLNLCLDVCSFRLPLWGCSTQARVDILSRRLPFQLPQPDVSPQTSAGLERRWISVAVSLPIKELQKRKS